MSQGSKELYKKAGVDIEKGDALVDWLKDTRSGTGVVEGIGGFAGLFRPDFSQMTDPLLIAGTDGVGTKVLLGIEQGSLEGLGQDLVAMCVNDLYCVGGKPLFFLDYFASGALVEKDFKAVMAGIQNALSSCGTALLGGETAELPGLYAPSHFDLAGFVVGVVDGAKRFCPDQVQGGDQVIALKSSGFHSNGYSLIRKWLEEKPASAELIKKLLEPTMIYSRLPELFQDHASGIHGLANITGGGVSGNLARVLPSAKKAILTAESLKPPRWMLEFLADHGASYQDVEAVLNMGIGMTVVAAREQTEQILARLQEFGYDPLVVGRIEERLEGEDQVVYEGDFL